MNLNSVSSVSDYKVLVVGDAILDRYIFVTTLGKSIKEPVIAVRSEKEELYKGGVWAGASHLRDFCAQVDTWHNGTIWENTRYVDSIYNRKLFTIHSSHIEQPEPLLDVGGYDLVIVCDFGHGTMTPELIQRLTREARFLAVNTQTNSQNFGFNLITKYPRADYVVLDELEARLAAQDNHSHIEEVILKLGFKKIVVTMGANGAIGFDREFYREKAQADRITDTMGAGDAFLCVSSLFACARFGIEDVVHIGNLAGAIKVGMLGHRGHVTKAELEKRL